MLKKLYRHIIWKLQGRKVFALVGRSGSGKSFRAKLLAEKYGIDLILDDGLLIYKDNIIAGRSAKREKTYLGAIKTAIFEDHQERHRMIKMLSKQSYKRILILGTSEKMIFKVLSRLYLPKPHKIFKIEDIATRTEITSAVRARKIDGKHVIPVPHTEITLQEPDFTGDPIKIFAHTSFLGLRKSFEKTEVKPQFDTDTSKGRVTISEAALSQMVQICISEYEPFFEVKKIILKYFPEGYALLIKLRIPKGISFAGKINDLQGYIISHLEQHGGVFVTEVNLEISEIY